MRTTLHSRLALALGLVPPALYAVCHADTLLSLPSTTRLSRRRRKSTKQHASPRLLTR